jgi:hypothetical protein
MKREAPRRRGRRRSKLRSIAGQTPLFPAPEAEKMPVEAAREAIDALAELLLAVGNDAVKGGGDEFQDHA